MVGRYLLSILMASAMELYFSMQEEGILLSILMPSAICVQFSQLLDRVCNKRMHFIRQIEQTHAIILVGTLERCVS